MIGDYVSNLGGTVKLASWIRISDTKQCIDYPAILCKNCWISCSFLREGIREYSAGSSCRDLARPAQQTCWRLWSASLALFDAQVSHKEESKGDVLVYSFLRTLFLLIGILRYPRENLGVLLFPEFLQLPPSSPTPGKIKSNQRKWEIPVALASCLSKVPNNKTVIGMCDFQVSSNVSKRFREILSFRSLRGEQNSARGASQPTTLFLPSPLPFLSFFFSLPILNLAYNVMDFIMTIPTNILTEVIRTDFFLM